MPFKSYGIYSKLHKTGCVVCGTKGTWAGEKLGSHKICIYCRRQGYHFSATQPAIRTIRVSLVLDENGNSLGEVRIRC